MGIEPTSEAWEARNTTQNTLDWRHFCDFRPFVWTVTSLKTKDRKYYRLLTPQTGAW
jgi:hypothetical protein